MPYRLRPPRPTSSNRLAKLAMTCRRVRPTASMTSSTSVGRTCDQAPTLGRPDSTSSSRAARTIAASTSPMPYSTDSIALRRLGSIGKPRRCAMDGTTSSASTSAARPPRLLKRGRERDRQLGGTGAGRTADGDEPPAPQSISVGHRSRHPLPVDSSFERADRRRGLIALGRKNGERVDELRHGGVRRNHPVDAQRGEKLATRRFLGIEDTEQAATAPVDRLDERPRQPGPAMTHDERAVLLVERQRRVHDDLADSRTAVIGEVAV